MDDGVKKIEKNVGLLNLNVHDDRKTHKRDIEHKTKTDDEVVATVVEITDADIDDTTTVASTSEPIVDSTTQIIETTEKTTETLESTTPSPATSTTQQTNSQLVNPGFQPILNYYYGGTPNENANYIYLTTSAPNEEITASTENPNKFYDRNDFGEFKPSVQYEYRNYRYNTDSHFIPIVGTKQIF